MTVKIIQFNQILDECCGRWISLKKGNKLKSKGHKINIDKVRPPIISDDEYYYPMSKENVKRFGL
jgi:hypothetical protein